jgi:hypothetical protein
MSMWCEELSATARAGLLADIDLLNPKNGRVYLRLMLYIARFGSAPNDGRLAEHLGVTKRYWNERAWPSLEDMFEIRGNRIFHPEIGGAPDVRRKAAAQVAAQARWGSKPQVISGSDELGNGSVTASESHTESHVNSMRGASETHANFDANACSDASAAASGASLAPSPSLASFASYQPTDSSIESQEGSESEGVDARASADASTHASGMRSDAITHPVTASASQANGHAKPQANRPPARTRVTEDWQPSVSVLQRASELLGRDASDQIEPFIEHYLQDGKTKLDWGATFRAWCRRQPGFEEQRGQIPLFRSIKGNRAEKTPSNGFDALVLRDGWGVPGEGTPQSRPSNPVTDYLATEDKKNVG